MSFSKNLEPCKPAGTDFGKIWRYADCGNGFRKHLGPCKPAGTDFENIWRYAGLHGRISKKFGAMQTLVPPKQEFFEVRTVFEGQTNAVRRPLKASLLRSFQTGTLGAVVTAVVVEFDFHLGFCELSCGR